MAWLQNMQEYSRMNGVQDLKDNRARGGNPCLEQTLEPYELCCLVETFPTNHDNLEDFKRTLKFAYLYAKTVTLGMTHWPQTNRVMLRNRRIGCSMSGIAQFITSHGKSLPLLSMWLLTYFIKDWTPSEHGVKRATKPSSITMAFIQTGLLSLAQRRQPALNPAVLSPC